MSGRMKCNINADKIFNKNANTTNNSLNTDSKKFILFSPFKVNISINLLIFILIPNNF